jgi:hypothetical protein
MHTGREGGKRRGAPHVPPSKDFKKLDHKNAIKHENIGFSHNPKYSPSKEFENDCASTKPNLAHPNLTQANLTQPYLTQPNLT